MNAFLAFIVGLSQRTMKRPTVRNALPVATSKVERVLPRTLKNTRRGTAVPRARFSQL